MGVNCSINKSPEYVIHDIRDALNYKVIILGDTAVGKTSVFQKYVDNSFHPEHRPTEKPVVKNIFQKVNVPDDYVASITLWDLPGYEDLDMRESYYRNVDAVIVVVDMTDPSTISMAGTWKQDFVNKASKSFTVTEVLPNGHTMTTVEKATFDPYSVPFLLLGNKYDKIEEQLKEEILKKLLQNPLLLDTENVSMTGDDETDQVIPGIGDDSKEAHIKKIEDEKEPKPKCVVQLEGVEEKYNFIGSMLVSAKLADSSVDVAFQTLLRHLLEKSRPEKVKLDTEGEGEVEPETLHTATKDNYMSYCGIEELDDIFRKCYIPVKRADDLENYYGLLLNKFQQMCLNNGFIYDIDASLEDCIVSINKAMYEICKVQIKVEEHGTFICLAYTEVDEKEMPEEIHATLKLFNTEFVAVCQTIQRESPLLKSIFARLHVSLTKITKHLSRKYQERADKYVHICHRNQARITFAEKQASRCLLDVENVKTKINAAVIW